MVEGGRAIGRSVDGSHKDGILINIRCLVTRIVNIHTLVQYSALNLPNKSLTPAKVITSEATNRSAIANEARKRLPILRRLRSV